MTIILTPNHAGFDALAAMVAATKIYPGSYALAPEKMQSHAALFMKNFADRIPVKSAAAELAGADLVVVVGGRRRSSLGALLSLVERARELHIYDHHPPSADDLEGSENRVDHVGAVTTLLLEEIRRRGVIPGRLERSLMLLGIYSGTACLSGANTTARDAAAAAYLWEQGIDAALLREYLGAPPAASGESLLQRLFEASELYEVCERLILLTTLPAAEQLQGTALLRRLQKIEEVDLAIALAARPRGGLHLRAWTSADDLDLPLLLAPLGAAGHRRAVSAEIESGGITAFKERLLEQLERYLPPPVTARQIASTPVAAVLVDWSVARVSEYLDAEGYSGCPVLEEGKAAGMITRRELQRALRSGLGDTPVRGFMKRPPVTASSRSPVTALRRSFVENKTDRIVLVGDAGEPLGVVAPMDILRYLYRLDRRPDPPLSPGSFLGKENEAGPVGIDEDNIAFLMRHKFPPRWESRLLLLGQRAAAMGISLYLVGGVIRDLLLGGGPPRDLDFVVIPDAIAFAGEAVKILGGKMKTFEHFGTASLFLEEGLRLDFATARREIYSAPAALPQVQGVESLKSDLYRRDFTINTLACSLLPATFGRVYDFFNGREDLRRGLVRTLYHLSFVDDPLRVLRAVRFEQRFGFQIEAETLVLMERALHSGVLSKVTRPRLAQEISLIYEERDPAAVLMRLHELGILEYLYPPLSPDHEMWQRLNRIGEALIWAEQRRWSKPPDRELLYLSGMLLGMERRDRQAVLRRLGLSRRRAGIVLQGCSEVPLLLEELAGNGPGPRPSVLVNRFDPLSPESLLLLFALARGGILRDSIRLYLDSLQYVRPRLRGGSLKKLGLQPGPLMGEILEALRRAVLDGKLRNDDEELDFVISYLEHGKEE